MTKQSAGILLYRVTNNELFIMLVHPGGPYWKNKDAGTWSIPKGEFTDEEPLKAAIREFEEETGSRVAGDFIELTPVKMKSGKVIYAWALEHEFDTTGIRSNEFQMEWPPRSGKMMHFPEVDSAGWFSLDDALKKINEGQTAILLQLAEMLGK